MNAFQAILLQAEQPPAAEQPSAFPASLPLIVMLGLVYLFIVIRPGRRDQKKREEMIKQLKKNDAVVTSGGILGTVASVSEDGTEVTVKVDDNTRLRVRSYAIAEVLTKPAPADAAAAK